MEEQKRTRHAVGKRSRYVVTLAVAETKATHLEQLMGVLGELGCVVIDGQPIANNRDVRNLLMRHGIAVTAGPRRLGESGYE